MTLTHATDAGNITITPLTISDVEDYVNLHIELLCVTYATIFTPRFAKTRRTEFAMRCEALLSDLEQTNAPEPWDEPYRLHYIARSHRGTPVGVMAAGRGVASWEETLLDQGWFPPATSWNLDHLYLAPGTHGTGLAETMVNIGVPDQHAYLWMYPDNTRALKFYQKLGFQHDGLTVTSPQESTYGDAPMWRLVR